MKNSDFFETERLAIRQFILDDVEKVYMMSREEGMYKWIPDQVYKDKQETAEVIKFLKSQYIEPNPEKMPYVLGVELKRTGELIGHIGLSPAESSVEIGYAIEEKYQGNGYATEVVSAMSDWALKELKLTSILGIVASENMGSCRVLEKAGYIIEEEKEKNAFGKNCMCKIYRME